MAVTLKEIRKAVKYLRGFEVLPTMEIWLPVYPGNEKRAARLAKKYGWKLRKLRKF